MDGVCLLAFIVDFLGWVGVGRRLFVCNICGLHGISLHRKGFSWDSINDIQQAAIGRNRNSTLRNGINTTFCFPIRQLVLNKLLIPDLP